MLSGITEPGNRPKPSGFRILWRKTAHFPETRVKVLYDSLNIYVIFNVRDQYVRAVEKEINGKVWMDSCVEFFFSPGADTERGYFNFEANCKGVFLFGYHPGNGDTSGFVSGKIVIK